MARIAATKTAAGDATRRGVVDAAYRLIVAHGYSATSMRDIAAEAGISAGSIYNHFPTKEAIVEEVLRTYHPVVTVMPVLATVEGDSVEELVRGAAQRIVRAIEASPGILHLIYVELVELKGQHLGDLLAEFVPLVRSFTDRVYRHSEAMRPREPLTFFRAFIGQLLAYLLTQRTLDTAALDGRSARLEDFVELFLYGVMKQ